MRSVACKLVLAVSDDGTLSLSLHLYMPPKSFLVIRFLHIMASRALLYNSRTKRLGFPLRERERGGNRLSDYQLYISHYQRCNFLLVFAGESVLDRVRRGGY